MDSYQRYQLELLPMEVECYDCRDEDRPVLPSEILLAVQQGNVDVIKDYLDKDGDVNALHEEECLLSRACAMGQAEIVKLLLQCPDVHLNIKFEGRTPLSRAAQNEHLECVKILIDGSVACSTPLDNSWKAIAKCLKMQPELQPRSAAHILRSASHRGHWDILRPILEMKHHYMKEDLYPLVLGAVSQNQWDVVQNVFKRKFYGRTEMANEVLAITVNMRNWEKAKEVLHVIDSDLKFEIAFVEACLSGDLPETKRLLAEGQYDSQTINGNLLVVAAGGISDPVADLLMTVKNIYMKGTFSNALFLSALGNCAELLPKLLHNAEASYSLNDLHKANEVLTRLPRFEKREGYLVSYFSEYLKKYTALGIEK